MEAKEKVFVKITKRQLLKNREGLGITTDIYPYAKMGDVVIHYWFYKGETKVTNI